MSPNWYTRVCSPQYHPCVWHFTKVHSGVEPTLSHSASVLHKKMFPSFYCRASAGEQSEELTHFLCLHCVFFNIAHSRWMNTDSSSVIWMICNNIRLPPFIFLYALNTTKHCNLCTERCPHRYADVKYLTNWLKNIQFFYFWWSGSYKLLTSCMYSFINSSFTSLF